MCLIDVAPYVGAWIETINANMSIIQLRVAPYVGAWIETRKSELSIRGCKVAPYVGAWIETFLLLLNVVMFLKSHPTWVRGLKQSLLSKRKKCFMSHPTWVRGLKHKINVLKLKLTTSHPTWVRGLKQEPYLMLPESHCRTLRGCVD